MEQPTQLGPFRILRVIGRGGMGAVYEAIHEDTNEHVAVKVLMTNVEEDQELRNRFEAEIETLKRLRHPNIVRLYGFGQEDGMLYYAMEFVDGPSLQNLLKSGRFFSWEEVVHIGIEVCKALKHAHDRGIIHRDIKPANILILSDGQVKVSDYGIAHFFGDSRLTTANMVIGTIEYMSPEQAQAGPLTPKSDIYSLGALLYALIARRPPYAAKSLAEILQKYKSGPPESVRFERPEVPSVLDLLILELLRVQPDKRPNDTRIIGRRLEAIRLALGPQQQINPFLDPENPNKIIPPSTLQDKSESVPPGGPIPSEPDHILATNQNTKDGDILFEINKSVPLKYPQNYQALDKDSEHVGSSAGNFTFGGDYDLNPMARANEPGSLLHLGRSENSRYDFLEETGQTAGTPRGADHDDIMIPPRHDGQSGYNLADITGISSSSSLSGFSIEETIASGRVDLKDDSEFLVSPSVTNNGTVLPQPALHTGSVSMPLNSGQTGNLGVGTATLSVPQVSEPESVSGPSISIQQADSSSMSIESEPYSEMPTQWTESLDKLQKSERQEQKPVPVQSSSERASPEKEAGSLVPHLWKEPVKKASQEQVATNAPAPSVSGVANSPGAGVSTPIRDAANLDVPPQTGPSIAMEPALLGSVFVNSSTNPSDSFTKTSHFTPVKEEDLGRLSHELEPHSKYVSLKIWLFSIISIMIGMIFVFALQNPTADKLYERIDRKIQDSDPDDYLSTLRSAEKDMKAFLSLYPNDIRAVTVLDYTGELELGNLERRLERLIERKTRTRNLDPVEAIYIDAIRTAKSDPEAGIPKLKAFIELFSTDERLQIVNPEKDPNDAVTAADSIMENSSDNRLVDSKNTASTENQTPVETSSEPESQTDSSDESTANSSEETDILRERKESFDRTIYGQCVILAKRQLEQINRDYQQSKSAQIRLLEGRLEYADSLDAVNPRQARAIRRAIVALYSERLWAVDLVAKANKSLQEDDRPE